MIHNIENCLDLFLNFEYMGDKAGDFEKHMVDT